MRTRCVLFLMLAAPVLAQGASFQDDQLAIELVCEHARLQAGATALVGLHFTLQPEWHIYWTNPGDSGLAPTVSWELPDGFAISDAQWPAPHRIPMEPLMTFGYSGEVTLLFELTVPAGAPAGEVKLVAHVAWMTCADVCLDGEARLELALPVADAPATPDAERTGLFAQARTHIPRPAPEGALTASRDGDDILVEVEVADAEPEAYFPADKDEIVYTAPQRAEGNVLRLRAAGEAVHALRGVLVFADGRAWSVDLPVSFANATVYDTSWAFYIGAGLVVVVLLLALIKLVM